MPAQNGRIRDMNERALSHQKPAAMRRRAQEFRNMAETASTEDDVRSLRALADRFDRFAEQLEMSAPPAGAA
jgi:hypothetical protein